MNAVRFFADCITGKDKLGLPDLANKVDPRRGVSRSLFVEGATPWVQESTWKTGKASDGAIFTASLEEVSFKGNGYTATFTNLVKVDKR